MKQERVREEAERDASEQHRVYRFFESWGRQSELTALLHDLEVSLAFCMERFIPLSE